MEINPPKTACGCLGGGVLKNDHTRSPLTLRNVFVNAQLQIYRVSVQISWGMLHLTTRHLLLSDLFAPAASDVAGVTFALVTGSHSWVYVLLLTIIIIIRAFAERLISR